MPREKEDEGKQWIAKFSRKDDLYPMCRMEYAVMRLAEQLRLYGSAFKKDSKELWQRMIFNILCNNTDDHLRNHVFLWDGKGWRLSPLYDVVPFPQVGTDRYLAIGVGQKGRHSTLTNALSEVESFGLSKTEAMKIVIDMQQKVKNKWKKVFKESHFSTDEIEQLKTCFIACEEIIQ